MQMVGAAMGEIAEEDSDQPDHFGNQSDRSAYNSDQIGCTIERNNSILGVHSTN